jgi:iron complex outermembrane receptor protein
MRTCVVALLLICCWRPLLCLGQKKDSLSKSVKEAIRVGEMRWDSASKSLSVIDWRITPVTIPDVVIKGFEAQRYLSETPSTIGYVSPTDLQRTAGTSFLPAFNTIPGVRMEERSPDSYRLSIRGSVIAAPFGVQNIKVYWEDIPLTDASGNTYLNVIDMRAINSAEILKGPAGSMYGAGTGGVLIMHPDTFHLAKAGVSTGSYHQFGEYASYGYHGEALSNTLFQSHSQSDGYRVNSASNRNVFQDWGKADLSKKDQISYLLSYTAIYYQTPGGLTQAEMEANPRAARPSTPTVPGASDQQAAINAQTWYTGLTNHYAFNDHWSNSTTLLYSGTYFLNPFLTDYEQRKELTLDASDRLTYQNKDFKGILGAGYQYLRSYIHDWGNTGGTPDTTQSNNKLEAFQFNPYLQINWKYAPNGLVEAGASLNTFQYHYLPLYGPNLADGVQRVNFHLQAMPRLMIQYGILPRSILVFASVSRGYSPPTISQIFPGTALLYNQLQPEQGWNYEMGFKAILDHRKLLLTLNLYDFRMQQSIVPRYDSAGHAYYVNAGGTDQKGVEGNVQYVPISNISGFWKYLRLFASYANQNYHFRNYLEGTSNYSGNPITGVPRNTFVSGLDLKIGRGLVFNTTYSYTSSISLNDAATAYAGSYQLLQGKIGWNFIVLHHYRHWPERPDGGILQLYAGIDNALNQVYSLGNDLNAVGGRYYNPAPGRNYFGGISFDF